MNRCLLSATFFLCIASMTRADVMILPPGIDRMALCDAVLRGKVVALEPQDVEVPFGGTSDLKFKFRIAVVEVRETIVGDKNAKRLRVGFVPAGERNRPFGFGRYQELNFNLAAGQEGLFFLRTHQPSKILHGVLFNDFVPEVLPKEVGPRQGMDYPSELQRARHLAKLMENPLASLKAKDLQDRLSTATYLIYRYRTPTTPKQKTEPVPLEESRLILQALLDQDWKQTRQSPTPWACFLMLGLTEKDGWRSPAKINDLNDARAAAQTWFRDAGTEYRMQRFAAEGK